MTKRPAASARRGRTAAAGGAALDGVLEDVRRRVRAAAHAGVPPDRLILALAELDPRGAADWLASRAGDAATGLTPAGLQRVLEAVAGASGRAPEPLGTERWRALLARHGAVAPGAVLAAASRELPRALWAEALAPHVDAALRRAPADAGLLRIAVEAARAAGDGAAAHRLLTRLGRADPGLATVSFVHRSRGEIPAGGAPAVRLALLSSFTADPLVPFLDLECRELGLAPAVYVAPFNTWEREVLSAETGLGRFAPELIFLAVSIDDLVPALAGTPGADELRAAGDEAVERVLAAARRLRGWSGATLVVHTFHSVYREPAGERGRGAWQASLNERLAAGLAELPRAFVLDVAEVLARRAGGSADNPKLRHLAATRLGEGALPELARSYARFVAPVKGLTRKCVVVDLDNTLWGGVVGEDGVHGIRLGDTCPGSEFRELQRYLKGLTERGILLAIASKNNAEDALQAIREHEAMVLREDDFSAVRINWLPKPDNVRAIAEELGIGVDALVFVDDNPSERELMRQALPAVLTPELPADPARYRGVLESLPQLEVLEATAEDRQRVALYRARRQRETLRASAGSLTEFLEGLGIEVEIEPAREATLARLEQLVQRTNQFNLTARRAAPGELAARLRDPSWRIYGLRARDRYSDHGLVATALVRAEDGRWRIDNFLMSCRVIGYGVETALLAEVAREARGAGARTLVGECVETPKNVPARDFYARHGFAPAEPEGAVLRWALGLEAGGGPANPSWIRVSHGA
ncbi:MAG TPA: HAD-IIIC family phosphatase [Longimicrobiales bacterium]|nr:HAD-IIIC family phosphatase [Longimicrobiales bacterium]